MTRATALRQEERRRQVGSGLASIAIGTDGLPVIGYEAGYRMGLGLLRCPDVLCSGDP
jgi:hypothetical protein